MKKIRKVLGKIISTLAAVCMVALAVLIAGPRLIGWQPYEVLSGSMEPTYHVGSVIYVRPASPDTVKANDPITFYLEDGKTIVTHRVVKVDPQKQCFYTKGDANKAGDGGSVPFAKLIGAPVYSIPNLGFIASYFNTRQGLIVAVTIIVCLLVLAFLPDALMHKKKGSQAAVKS